MSKYGAAAGADFPADPGASDDCLSGFFQGFIWRNSTSNALFRCNSNLPGAAVWSQLGSGGGTGPSLASRITTLETLVTALEAAAAARLRQTYALGPMGPFIFNHSGPRQFYANGLIINE